MTPTPVHSFRIPDDVWAAAEARAATRGETLTDVVRRALTDDGHVCRGPVLVPSRRAQCTICGRVFDVEEET